MQPVSYIIVIIAFIVTALYHYMNNWLMAEVSPKDSCPFHIVQATADVTLKSFLKKKREIFLPVNSTILSLEPFA